MSGIEFFQCGIKPRKLRSNRASLGERIGSISHLSLQGDERLLKPDAFGRAHLLDTRRLIVPQPVNVDIPGRLDAVGIRVGAGKGYEDEAEAERGPEACHRKTIPRPARTTLAIIVIVGVTVTPAAGRMLNTAATTIVQTVFEVYQGCVCMASILPLRGRPVEAVRSGSSS